MRIKCSYAEFVDIRYIFLIRCLQENCKLIQKLSLQVYYFDAKCLSPSCTVVESIRVRNRAIRANNKQGRQIAHFSFFVLRKSMTIHTCQ